MRRKEGLPVFDTDILNTFFFLPTAEINARLPGKISKHIPTAERLRLKGSGLYQEEGDLMKKKKPSFVATRTNLPPGGTPTYQ